MNLASDGRIPFGSVRVLEVGHKNVRAAVESIDDHFAIDWTSDFHSPIAQIRGHGRDFPIRFANLGRGRQEMRRQAGSQGFLYFGAAFEQRKPRWVEKS